MSDQLSAREGTHAGDYFTMKTSKEKIGPKRAAALLERNTENRPLSQPHVRALAEEMRAGRWKVNGDTICFAGNRLIDGQHRLWAIMESGCTIEMLMVEGLADDVFTTKDVGRRRSAGDILHIAGKGAEGLAPAATMLRRYQTGAMNSPLSIPHAILLETVDQNPGLRDSLAAVPQRGAIAPRSVLAVFHFLATQHDAAAVGPFMDAVLHGTGTRKGDAAYVLHNALVRNQACRRKMLSRFMLALFVKAWNAQRAGRSVEVLVFRGDESFPTVGTPPPRKPSRTGSRAKAG